MEIIADIIYFFTSPTALALFLRFFFYSAELLVLNCARCPACRVLSPSLQHNPVPGSVLRMGLELLQFLECIRRSCLAMFTV